MNKFIFIIVLLFSCEVLNAQISGVIIDEKNNLSNLQLLGCTKFLIVS